MNVWLSEDWRTNHEIDPYKGGLQCRFDSNCADEVKEACKRFTRWLRRSFQFPVKVSVFFKANDSIEASDGECVSALFVEPYERSGHPHIYIAVGSYAEHKDKVGRDAALGGILRSAAHELTHYYQWLNDVRLTGRGYEIQARYYADVVIDWYATTCEHP